MSVGTKSATNGVRAMSFGERSISLSRCLLSPTVVRVPVERINGILTERTAPKLDLVAIENSLRKDGVWMGSDTSGQETGWLIDRDWWDTQWRLESNLG